MKTEPNEPISPTYVQRAGAGFPEATGGLTKREYFASLAMQGYLANPEFALSEQNIKAQCAVQMADALIAALNNQKEAQ